MSFFYDFLESFSIDDIGDKICCDLIFGQALKLLANFKIEEIGENEIILKCKKIRIKISGANLKIVTLAKGELEVTGIIDGVVKLWANQSK